MNHRIEQLIKALEIKKIDFAKRLNLSPSFVSDMCSGKGNPSDRTILDICRAYNVSEKWLRSGEGEMFVDLHRNEALAAQIQEFLQGGTDSFRERLVSLLLRLKPEQWDALEGYLVELMAAPSSDAGKNIPAPAASETTASPDIAAKLAELERQNKELAAKVAAMEEEDAILYGESPGETG